MSDAGESDCRRYALGDVVLQCGEILRDAELAFETHGEINSAKDVMLLPTFLSGCARV